jgi:hypothetical protein
MDDINALRNRLRQRRHRRTIVIVILVALILAGVLFLVAPNGLGLLSGSAPADKTPAPAGGTAPAPATSTAPAPATGTAPGTGSPSGEGGR